jgi:hypothetical protein
MIVDNYPGSLQELTAAIGLTPSRMLPAGEVVSPGHERKSDRWVLDAVEGDQVPLDEQLVALLAKVTPASERLASLPDATRVRVMCGIFDYQRSVPLVFPRPVISALEAIKAELEIDYYLKTTLGES